MLINKTVKYSLIAICVLSLTACSTLGKGKGDGANGAEVADANGASASGIGNEENFGSQGNANAMRVGNQVYYFDFDQSMVRDSDKPSIEVQARHLASNNNSKVVLEGHTDPRGSREYNIALGERRARSVADTLKVQGAHSNQIRVVSYGSEKRAAAGTTEEDYQLDRRVHLNYEDKG